MLFFLWGEEPDCVTSISLLGSRRCSCICPVPPLLDLACKCESLVGKFPWSLPWVADCSDERKIYIQCLTMVRNVFCCVWLTQKELQITSVFTVGIRWGTWLGSQSDVCLSGSHLHLFVGFCMPTSVHQNSESVPNFHFQNSEFPDFDVRSKMSPREMIQSSSSRSLLCFAFWEF